MMKGKLYILLYLITLSLFLQKAKGQVFIYGQATPSISNENPFFDASATFDWSIVPNSTGKGFVFPRVDLTQWVFQTQSLSDGFIFPGAFDGMIVYNITSGNTLADDGSGNNPTTSTVVTPGFYYFSNPGPFDGTHYSITNGKWVRMTNDLDLISQTVSVSDVAPPSASVGMVYFNTTDNRFYKCTAIGPPDTWTAVSAEGGGENGLPAVTASDANKLLTVNSDGTAVSWQSPYFCYHPSNNNKFFCRASGLGVTATLVDNTLTITVPVGVFLDYFKFTSSYAELGSQNEVHFVIDDKNKKWNNSFDDVIVPVVNLIDRVQVSPTIIDNIFSPATNTMQLVVTSYSDGVLKMYSGSVGDHQSASGFYFTFHF